MWLQIAKARLKDLFMKVLGLIFSTASGRVRVAVRLRPRNAEDIVSDADFSDCVELQPEVIYMSHSKITLMLNLSLSLSLSLTYTHTHTHTSYVLNKHYPPEPLD